MSITFLRPLSLSLPLSLPRCASSARWLPIPLPPCPSRAAETHALTFGEKKDPCFECDFFEFVNREHRDSAIFEHGVERARALACVCVCAMRGYDAGEEVRGRVQIVGSKTARIARGCKERGPVESPLGCFSRRGEPSYFNRSTARSGWRQWSRPSSLPSAETNGINGYN